MKIIFTGPESSGKTTLAVKLSNKFKLPLVNEQARTYLTEIGVQYKHEDLTAIAKMQNEEEEKQAKKSKIILADTDVITIYIWKWIKYGIQQFSMLNEVIADAKNRTYLLCKPDIPWQYDPLRESKYQREYLFERYETVLKKLEMKYFIIDGSYERREKKALEIVSSILK